MGKPRLTEEQIDFIRQNFDLMSCEELRKAFNEKYHDNFKTTAFHYHTKRLGLEKWKEHTYTDEQEAFLKESASTMTREELTTEFNKKFSCEVSCDALSMRCWQKGYGRATDGKFHKGSVPWEKTSGGRNAYIKTIKGGNCRSFKKGQVAHNAKPIGAESEWCGETYIKTTNGWISKRRDAWKKQNGAIPMGMKIISVDGNKHNTDANNLRIADNDTIVVLMANDWIGKGAEVFDAGAVYAKLYNALKRDGYDIKGKIRALENEN